MGMGMRDIRRQTPDRRLRVKSITAATPALQYARAPTCHSRADRRAEGRRSSAPPACSLRVGDHRFVIDRARVADPHAGPLLARHPLEPALNVGSAPREVVAPEPLLVVVLGPTASGKTALSLALAQKFNGEIVNCDSVAMVREFDIGTAKPSASERESAPHHLFDVIAPTQYITAGEYSRQARQVLREIHSRRHICPSWSAAPDSTCARCSKGSFPARSVPTNCATACGRALRNVAPIIFTGFFVGSTPRLRKEFTLTMSQN